MKEGTRKNRMTCFDRASNMLARRAYAVKELYSKLLEKGYAEEQAREAIARLTSYNFLNDERFAYERVRYRAEISGWGKKRIMTELFRKGIDSALAEQQFLKYMEEEAKEGLEEKAYTVLIKKYGQWNDNLEDEYASYDVRMEQRKEIEKEKSRRINFLMRRGFSLNEALSALEKTTYRS